MADDTCGVSNVQTACSFSGAENRRFRNELFEALEELRVRRAMDSENEERIRQLVHEKHQLQIKVDETEKLRNEAVMRQEERVSNVKQQQQQRIKDLEQEKKKMFVSCQITEEEQKSLKDEIRSLELCKYTLEKRVKELEQKLDRQHVSGALSDNQLIEVEQLTECMKKRLNDLSRQVERLQKNIEESEAMNTKLWSLYEEQKVEICQHKQQNNKLSAELVKVRVKADQLPCEMLDKLSVLQKEKDTLSNALKTKEETINRLKIELIEAQQLTRAKADSLKDAHNLLERHIEQGTTVNNELIVCQTRLGEQLEKYGKLKEEFNETCKQREVDVQAHKNTQEQWQKQMDSLSEDMDNLREMDTKQKLALTELEELNSTWAEKNLQLTKDINQLKCEQEKSTCDSEVQVQTVVMETEIQTEPVAREHVNIQVTMETDVTDRGTETMTTDCTESSAQTDLMLLPKCDIHCNQIDDQPVNIDEDNTVRAENSAPGDTQITCAESCAPGDTQIACAENSAMGDIHTKCAENHTEYNAVDDMTRKYTGNRTDSRASDVIHSGIDSSPDLLPSSQETTISQTVEKKALKSPPGPGAQSADTKSLLGVVTQSAAVSSLTITKAPMIVSPFGANSTDNDDNMSPNQRFLRKMKQISTNSATSDTDHSAASKTVDTENANTDLRTRLQRNTSLTRSNRLSLSRHSFLNFPEPITSSPSVSIETTQTTIKTTVDHMVTTSDTAVAKESTSPSNQSVIASLSEILSTDNITHSNSTTSAVAMDTRRDTIATDGNSKRPAGILHYPTSLRSSKRRRKSVTFSDAQSDEQVQPDSPVYIVPETPTV